ncbi:TIGR04282 family arsenosugar biosynthesis glycosyltransferase [Glacieibacterium frigidum]|uniref:Glycosyltransferase n=1 Tax=Glacieibacterium frigidum TaxID=2593303 RepID=A0A552UF93_9SPHN|nr:TIGR04282 family arsenosugar biosynthesis glycosyltransferase [Glacieibacterium frigidum]TRW16896.1 glycosyltransferase [Glacieibacterium frigidum]
MRVCLFTRWPEAGKAKTRLIPALGAAGAADLHRRLTEHTVATVLASGLHCEVRSTGAEVGAFEDWLGVAAIDQGDGDLGERLARAAEDLPVLLIGADCPGLTHAHLQRAADALAHAAAVIGPAEDGGYWLLGLAAPAPVFDGIAWGGPRVFAQTVARLSAPPVVLDCLADLDVPADLARWPGF